MRDIHRDDRARLTASGRRCYRRRTTSFPTGSSVRCCGQQSKRLGGDAQVSLRCLPGGMIDSLRLVQTLQRTSDLPLKRAKGFLELREFLGAAKSQLRYISSATNPGGYWTGSFLAVISASRERRDQV